MTVTDVLLNFRRALLAVIPAVEKVGFSWRSPDSYDEWDSIATTLFDVLVVEVLRWSLDEPVREAFRMPPYDLVLESYDGLSVLRVKHPSLVSGRYLFHSFGSSDGAFDLVQMRRISEADPSGELNLTACPLEDATFSLELTSSLDRGQAIEVVDAAKWE